MTLRRIFVPLLAALLLAALTVGSVGANEETETRPDFGAKALERAEARCAKLDGAAVKRCNDRLAATRERFENRHERMAQRRAERAERREDADKAPRTMHRGPMHRFNSERFAERSAAAFDRMSERCEQAPAERVERCEANLERRRERFERRSERLENTPARPVLERDPADRH